ncbi:MAG: heavy-metal-associated domain-containing protein [Myxococcales bacterium]|nr:heavy-metal-associated domain-containing protein [Myxococcales bacterium]
MSARRHLALAAALALGGVGVLAPACGPTQLAEADTVVTTLRVEGMVCESCEGAIGAELAKLDGVLSAKASHTEESVEVRHDPERATVDAIAAAIEKLGYKVVR